MSQIKDPAIILLFCATAALAAALTSQYAFGLLPCPLCIYQRIPYVVVICLALLGLVLRGNTRLATLLVGLCGLAFCIGSGLALYHTGVEQHWWAGPASCSGGIGTANSVEDLISQLSRPIKVPACDEVAWSLFGISMAGYNLLASIALATFSLVTALRRWKS